MFKVKIQFPERAAIKASLRKASYSRAKWNRESINPEQAATHFARFLRADTILFLKRANGGDYACELPETRVMNRCDMKIGITGHQHVDDVSEWSRITTELQSIIAAELPPLIGLTSLAIGADQLFADVVLENGGSIEAIIPFDGYESKFEEGSVRQNYQRLLARATKVTTLPPEQTEERSYPKSWKNCGRVIRQDDCNLGRQTSRWHWWHS